MKTVDISKVYSVFCEKYNEIRIFIDVLTNAIHSNGIYTDIKVSLLIQCAEGYIRKYHITKKFSDETKKVIIDTMLSSLDSIENEVRKEVELSSVSCSVNGILGNLNSPNFQECIEKAFDLNEYTKEILKYQRENNTYSSFIVKSKNTRNMFSHMCKKENTFSGGSELIMAINKYVLLLRLLILQDIGISASTDSVTNYIKLIEN